MVVDDNGTADSGLPHALSAVDQASTNSFDYARACAHLTEELHGAVGVIPEPG